MTIYSIIRNKETEIKIFEAKTQKEAMQVFREFLEEQPKYDGDSYSLVKGIAFAIVQ